MLGPKLVLYNYLILSTLPPCNPTKIPEETRKKTYDTPQKSKIQGAHEYLVAKGIPIDEREIFDSFSVLERSRYRIIENRALSPTRKNQEGVNKTRGRKSKLSGANVRETDYLLEETGLDLGANGIHWDAIAWTLDHDVLGHTLQRTMRDTITNSKYVSALKEFLP
ncbi:hypothetical protein OEA41_010552 [Lepraria neglecta]|uniref:Uncharacterized protein n=1 Tax=Lepraria neglecta TaxID=209136 RepID=A0AAE0DFP3_9LECA|nr:hypothetical protein OEA41_010552 [Lepraria neglecta]